MAGRGARRQVAAALLAMLLCAAWSSLMWEGAEAADAEQLVTNLPGAPPGLTYEQYAGTITVDEAAGKALFYWFFTADSTKASSKPLAIWLNGGPGCSSVGNGLLAELGPFYPAGTLDKIYLNPNKHTWIKEANIIFLESPVAVGFSYSNSSLDYSTFSDKQTAVDNLKFLLLWLEKFPEYKKNDFYLIGESYAGHYIPNLAQEIVAYNDLQGQNGFRVNFIGYAIGNPWTDAYFNNLGATEWWHSHDLISDDTYETILKYCDFAADEPVDYADINPLCLQATNEANLGMLYLDPYSIYTPYCNVNLSSGSNTSKFGLLHRSREAASGLFRADTSSDDPCTPDLITAYLNKPDVQRALHVSGDVLWSSCSDAVIANYSIPDLLQSMLPIHEQLISRGLRAWIFNGDTDAICPTTTARYAIRSLKYKIRTPWYPWRHGTQVGGSSQIYEGLTFATVRDAGHFVPFAQPGRALSLFKHFLAATELPGFPV